MILIRQKQRIYNCSDYTEYYFNENETSDNTDIQINDVMTYCSELYAEANYNDNYCIGEDIGCDDPLTHPLALVQLYMTAAVIIYMLLRYSPQHKDANGLMNQNATQGELNPDYTHEIVFVLTPSFNYASMVIEAIMTLRWML